MSRRLDITTPQRARTAALVLEATARGLRSGHSLSSTLLTALDTHASDDRLIAIGHRHRQGEPLSASLDHARHACREDEDLRLAVAVLSVAARHGGPSAEALDRAASTLRDHAALADDAHTHAAPARLSATVLAVTPVAVTLVGATLDDRVRHVLIATPAGWGCILVGATLIGLGRWWMTTLVRVVV